MESQTAQAEGRIDGEPRQREGQMEPDSPGRKSPAVRPVIGQTMKRRRRHPRGDRRHRLACVLVLGHTF